MIHSTRTPNRLINEKSPYLLQHANNPVDWYPWGEEAFAKAKAEDKPVFLSIGYSTCHWCHVMEHESFENEETAKVLNKYFVSIKVDREERPDIDSVYMNVCQAFTGSGGWPTSIFMTPDQKPFYAGTYYPIKSQYGMIGFADLLRTIANEWKENSEKLIESGNEIIRHLSKVKTDKSINEVDLIEKAAEIYKSTFDRENGGFGHAPKFPAPHNLIFLLLYAKINNDDKVRGMVTKTLLQMRKGGIFDHIGYGFSRYSTDEKYLVPHFEKMLYDNALLIIAYVMCYKQTSETLFLDTAKKTAEYILREMADESGAFYSAQDADTNGDEGKYYVFQYDEILNVLGEDIGKRFNACYNITKEGNFEGKNIPNQLHRDEISDEFDMYLPKLYEYRKQREKLHLDDKILTSWNAMMIVAFVYLYQISKDEIYLNTAIKSQSFIEENLFDGEKLYVSYRDKKRSAIAFLDDYAYYTAALLALYDATLDKKYLNQGVKICRSAVEQFFYEKGNGFYLSGKNNEKLVFESKETYDGATPSGNSVMLYNLLRLSNLTGDDEWKKLFEGQQSFMSGEASDYPVGYSMSLLVLLMSENPSDHIIIVLKDKEDMNEILQNKPFFADIEILEKANNSYPLLNDKTTYYVCKGHTCYPPANNI